MAYYPPQGAHRAPTTSPATAAGRAASPLRDEFDPYAEAGRLALELADAEAEVKAYRETAIAALRLQDAAQRELERTREALAAMTALASDQVTACRVLAWLDGGA